MTNSATFFLNDPHPPTVHASRYIYSGRGGAGNAIPASRTSSSSSTTTTTSRPPPPPYTPTAPATTPANPPPPAPYFATGRGGAGNMHRDLSRDRLFAFDEELAAQARLWDHAAPIYHIGRGGAGNAVDEFRAQQRRKWTSSSGNAGGGAATNAGVSGKKVGGAGDANGGWSEGGSSAESDDAKHARKRSVEEAWAKVARSFGRRS